ncbi:hypothetical protein EJB05_33509, partial [Eragrostis curvula]
DWTTTVGGSGVLKRSLMKFYPKKGKKGRDEPESSGRRGGGRGGGGGRGRGRGRPLSPEASSEEEHEEEQRREESSEEEAKRQDEEGEEGEDEEGEEEEGEEGEDGAEGLVVPVRSLTLPRRPIPFDRRPMIRPRPPRNWDIVVEGIHRRKVNGILGTLCRQHFPGMILLAERIVPCETFEHYTAVPNFPDTSRRVFTNKMERVIMELWARAQAIVESHADRNVRVNKKEAGNMRMARYEYIKAIPWWMAPHPQCWELKVNQWCTEGWEEKHSACREHRLMMPGAAHHQGSLSLNEYAARYAALHGGKPINTFEAYALSHKGKATANIQYNPDDPPKAYINPSVHSRLSSYSEVAKEVHGTDFDPRSHDLDGEVVMRAGGGKRHGRFYPGDSVIDTASTPTPLLWPLLSCNLRHSYIWSEAHRGATGLAVGFFHQSPEETDCSALRFIPLTTLRFPDASFDVLFDGEVFRSARILCSRKGFLLLELHRGSRGAALRLAVVNPMT